MLAVTGYRSRLIEELKPLLPKGEEVVRIHGTPPLCERYVLAAGVLRPKRLRDQTSEQMSESLEVNLVRPMELCEEVLERNDTARIVVMGSESGFAWSYDDVYAAGKAALHRYVEAKKLKPNQQLVCIAPSIIEDTTMTESRTDVENLARRRETHPKRRFLKAAEVARLIHYLLYVDEGYLTGTVIRMNGGASCSR